MLRQTHDAASQRLFHSYKVNSLYGDGVLIKRANFPLDFYASRNRVRNREIK
jgi:hypothetical protein